MAIATARRSRLIRPNAPRQRGGLVIFTCEKSVNRPRPTPQRRAREGSDRPSQRAPWWTTDVARGPPPSGERVVRTASSSRYGKSCVAPHSRQYSLRATAMMLYWWRVGHASPQTMSPTPAPCASSRGQTNAARVPQGRGPGRGGQIDLGWWHLQHVRSCASELTRGQAAVPSLSKVLPEAPENRGIRGRNRAIAPTTAWISDGLPSRMALIRSRDNEVKGPDFG